MNEIENRTQHRKSKILRIDSLTRLTNLTNLYLDWGKQEVKQEVNEVKPLNH